MDVVLNIMTLAGSLGLFLFGMKVMSEALQKTAGFRLRNVLAGMTSNRFRGILAGFLITGLIQSSSAVTVMIVSFVNAGLLALSESLGLIMGANIGTTVTAWLISLLGFNLKISHFALPLIGLGFPLVFSRRSARKNLGEFMIGFAVIFIGLEFLKTTVPDISTRPELVQFVSNYTEEGFLSILLFLLAGTIITVIIQSSSAAMALTLVMCYKGWIDFEHAAAMVLGENIGTTVTANFAALVANKPAKRSAFAHFMFNLIGVLWAVPLIRPFLYLINVIMISFNITSPFEDVQSIPVAISIFHTSFNIINTLILAGFMKQLEKLATVILRSRKDSEEQYRLKHFTTGLFSTSELSILQARKEIGLYGRRTFKMFQRVRDLFSETNDERFQYHYDKITNYEEICDRMEVEIATYLTRIAEGELSQPGTKRIRAMLKLIDDIESIADSCNIISATINRKRTQKIWFPQLLRDKLNSLFDMVEEAFNQMNENLEKDPKQVDYTAAKELDQRILAFLAGLHKEHLDSIEHQKYKYQAGVVYKDLLDHLGRLAGFIINISEALYFPSHHDPDIPEQ